MTSEYNERIHQWVIIPLTVGTGFLGPVRTALLNRILSGGQKKIRGTCYGTRAL
jgi:hypothetical protein